MPASISPPLATPNAHGARRPLLIVKLGDTLSGVAQRLGDFEHWIARGLHDGGDAAATTGHADSATPANPVRQISLLDPRRGDAFLPPDQVAGVVLTGSPAMVTDRAPWSEATAQWLRELVCAGTPVLGICYGHQLLAHALGGEAGNNPRGMELGTVDVQTLPAAHEDALFQAMPKRFPAQVVHRQSALRLPPGAVVLAANDCESHHAVRFDTHCWGVQFHPEFNAEAMRLYVEQLAPSDAHTLQAVRPTPDSAALLPRFVQLVEAREALRQPLDTHAAAV